MSKCFSSRSGTFALLACLVALTCSSEPQFVSSCLENEKIDPRKRSAVEDAALRFTRASLSNDANSAYDQFTTEVKQNLTREQFEASLRQILLPLGSLKDVKAQHTYLLDLIGTSPQRIVCGNDISRPQGWVAVAAKDVPEQAHVLVGAQALNNAWVFALWLIPEHGQWRVQSFYANAATLADKSGEDVWLLARAEKDKGHFLNAAILYTAAASLAFRGPNFQLGILPTIQEEMQQLSVAEDLKGQPPFLWKGSGRSFKVLQLGPISIGGKTYLVIDHEVEPWKNDEQVEGWSRELMRYFVARFPEYSEIFAGLVIRGRERGSNRLFGTVEEVPLPPGNPPARHPRQ